MTIIGDVSLVYFNLLD